MKSLNDNYVESGGGGHETFADLVFCALVVLVLFIVLLVIEVSERVRADQDTEPMVKVSAAEFAELNEAIKSKDEELKIQNEKMVSQGDEIESQAAKIDDLITEREKQKAALSGERRFTGLTEPAGINLAYDYSNDKFYFVAAKKLEHAAKRTSGESDRVFNTRSIRELGEIAIHCHQQRAFTLSEMTSIYGAFTQYQEIDPTDTGFSIFEKRIGIDYSVLLSKLIASDVNSASDPEEIIVNAMLKVYNQPGSSSDQMHPTCKLTIDNNTKSILLGGVTLSARDLRDILLSFDGRGAMLDLEGIDGPAPIWLVKEVLKPTGYISKTPRIPE